MTQIPPAHANPRAAAHTLSALVANKPGVLARIAQVFARRGYNIDSLVVSSDDEGRFSRMTITAIGNPAGLSQIIAQVNKLIDVVHCFDHTGQDAVVKELALIKVAVTPAKRTEVLQIAEHFRARSVDMSENSMVFMITGGSAKVDALIDHYKAYGIQELVRTGKVVMSRGAAET